MGYLAPGRHSAITARNSQCVGLSFITRGGGGARRPRARAIAVGFALDILGRCLLWLENGGMGVAALWRGLLQGSHEYVL